MEKPTKKHEIVVAVWQHILLEGIWYMGNVTSTQFVHCWQSDVHAGEIILAKWSMMITRQQLAWQCWLSGAGCQQGTYHKSRLVSLLSRCLSSPGLCEIHLCRKSNPRGTTCPLQLHPYIIQWAFDSIRPCLVFNFSSYWRGLGGLPNPLQHDKI